MDKNDKLKADDGGKQSDEKKREEELKRKVEEFENKHKRALADYQNLEKRVAEERRELILKANKELLLRLLPVLDTLILAQRHIKIQDEGLTLSVKKFEDVLREEGIEKIEALGKQFDPRLMQCVETAEGEEGKVLEELQTGYKYKDHALLRAAFVKVGKKEQEKEEEEKAKKELQKGNYM